MNPPTILEILVLHDLFIDAAGILGLGLVGMAAAKLAASSRSRGAGWMAAGALAQIAARLYFLTASHLPGAGFHNLSGTAGSAASSLLPPLLLTFGLLAVVGGFWQHERTLTGTRS